MPHRFEVQTRSFGPHRALLRALLLKSADEVQIFAKHFDLDVTEILVSDRKVSQDAIVGLWQLAERVSLFYPFIAMEAARLFQLTDLGERGWLLSSAQDLSVVIGALREFLLHDNLSVVELGHEVVFRWTPDGHFPQPMSLYWLSVGLQFLFGQGILLGRETQVILPEICRPSTQRVQDALLNRFASDFGLTVIFRGDDVELRFNAQALAKTLRTADETVFQFFLKRCREQAPHDDTDKLLSKETLLIDKVKKLLLCHLSSSEFGSIAIASELGISTRTLERALAKEKMSLRLLKQDLQRKTAEEMLVMGVRAKEVAAQIGFEDVTAFSRAFQKWTGSSPTQFKKKKQHG